MEGNECGLELIKENTVIWDNCFDLLKKFMEEYKREPKVVEEYQGVKLGQWLEEQRNNTDLSSENKQRMFKVLVGSKGKSGAKWIENYETLCKYKAEGNQKLQKLTVYDNKNLGSWVWTQRNTYMDGKLSEEKIYLLNLQGVILKSKRKETQSFAETYEIYNKLLQKYNDSHNGPPAAETVYYNKKIGLYYKKLLKYKAVGRNAEDPVSVKHRSWEEMYQLVDDYRKAHNNKFPKPEECCKVSNGSGKEELVNIGNWVVMQRQLWKNNKLSGKHKDALTDIGFVLDPRNEEWDRKCEIYSKFRDYIKEQEGEVREPKRLEAYEGVDIGLWCERQRIRFKNGRMPEDKKKKLEQLNSAIVARI